MVLNLGVLAIRRYIMFEQVTRFTAMLNLLCNRGMKIQTQDPVSCLASHLPLQGPTVLLIRTIFLT